MKQNSELSALTTEAQSTKLLQSVQCLVQFAIHKQSGYVYGLNKFELFLSFQWDVNVTLIKVLNLKGQKHTI